LKNILITNGTIVTAGDSFEGSVLIEGDVITDVFRTSRPDHNADVVIDAGGHYIIPGAIDPHVHLELDTPGGRSADDFKTGTKAAIAGGTTTIIDFVTPGRNESLAGALKKRKQAAQKSLTDWSLHMSITGWNDETAAEIRHCIENEGITSFKIYLAYQNTIGIDDHKLAQAMEAIGQAGGMALLHCENDALIGHLQSKFIAEGKTSPVFHPLSRPVEAESTAVLKAINYSKVLQCPVYIVHVSAGASVDLIARAQEDGIAVFAETCPQYLLLGDSVYDQPFEQSAKFVMSPPLRSGFDQWKLWKAAKDGTVQSIGTDHCPFNLHGQKDAGKDNFTLIPNGAGGIEHRPALLFTYGVLNQRFSINRWVELIATGPAGIFGLAHRKGDIRPGMDADIVIWNPEKKSVISATNHVQNCDSNIYEGFKTQGAPEMVMMRGKVVFENGKFQLQNAKGSFLKRGLSKVKNCD
jgi:dihydropyrimidinase